MNSTQENKCHAIIHSASALAAAAGAGLALLPGSDSAVIIPIQVGMVISLGAVFGKEISKSVATSTLTTATTTMVGRGISQFLVGWIPGFGNALNATTAAAVTETAGWAVANSFASES